MRHAAFAVLTVALFGATCAQASDHDSLRQTLGTLPQFKLTDQSGNIVDRGRVLGKVCVFSVFFSCCIDSCPITQKTMAELQKKFASYPDVMLISINVYPGHDTPEIIAEYASTHHADPARWLFLHGDKDEIYRLVQKGLLQGLEESPSSQPGREIVHTPNLLVVDSRGVIRGYVDGTKAGEVARLEEYVRQLQLAKYFPPINAGLNATCAVLLVAGFVLIRRRWVRAHKACMLAALAVSAIFLGSYLYYHIAVMEGQPTQFSGEGAARAIYLLILLSHTILAAIVAPMALRVAYLGIRNRLSSHTVLARWTLPIWIYVSLTGIVVYWMLYHLYPPV